MSDIQNKPKYKFHFKREYWNCGDGCCSDSWHNLEVQDPEGKVIYEQEEIRYVYDVATAFKKAVDVMDDLDINLYTLEIKWDDY